MREHITFGFVGIGLIGGSVAKALRRVYPSCKIIVYNRSAEPRVMAINDGTANVAVPQVNETFNECDYIFLCTPVEKNVEYLKILKDIIKDDCIITDVGSVKGNIHKAVEELGLEKNFIGGHPMAGSEKTSYTYANDRLVENAYYAITPTDAVSKERVEEFTEMGMWMLAAFIILLDICLFMYDRLLVPMTVLYANKLRPRLRFLIR